MQQQPPHQQHHRERRRAATLGRRNTMGSLFASADAAVVHTSPGGGRKATPPPASAIWNNGERPGTPIPSTTHTENLAPPARPSSPSLSRPTRISPRSDLNASLQTVKECSGHYDEFLKTLEKYEALQEMLSSVGSKMAELMLKIGDTQRHSQDFARAINSIAANFNVLELQRKDMIKAGFKEFAKALDTSSHEQKIVAFEKGLKKHSQEEQNAIKKMELKVERAAKGGNKDPAAVKKLEEKKQKYEKWERDRMHEIVLLERERQRNFLALWWNAMMKQKFYHNSAASVVSKKESDWWEYITLPLNTQGKENLGAVPIPSYRRSVQLSPEAISQYLQLDQVQPGRTFLRQDSNPTTNPISTPRSMSMSAPLGKRSVSVDSLTRSLFNDEEDDEDEGSDEGLVPCKSDPCLTSMSGEEGGGGGGGGGGADPASIMKASFFSASTLNVTSQLLDWCFDDTEPVASQKVERKETTGLGDTNKEQATGEQALDNENAKEREQKKTTEDAAEAKSSKQDEGKQQEQEGVVGKNQQEGEGEAERARSRSESLSTETDEASQDAEESLAEEGTDLAKEEGEKDKETPAQEGQEKETDKNKSQDKNEQEDIETRKEQETKQEPAEPEDKDRQPEGQQGTKEEEGASGNEQEEKKKKEKRQRKKKDKRKGKRKEARKEQRRSKEKQAQKEDETGGIEKAAVKVKVVFPWKARSDAELDLQLGQELLLVSEQNEEWWLCNDQVSGGKTGLVPSSYVRRL